MSRRIFSMAYMCLIIIFLSVYYIPHVASEGHCIWYGSCTLPNSAKVKNCYYDGPAKPIEEETRHILRQYCPELAAGGKVCCDSSQLRTLDSSIKIAVALLDRCPTCFDNFRKHICYMSCAPDQSDFLKPVNLAPFNATHKQVIEIDYHLSYEYMEATFNSCSNVQIPGINQVVFDLMCGEYGSSYCTPQRLFAFMGDASSPFVPFQINYKSKVDPADGYLPLNLTTSPCNVGSNGKPGCSCMDCTPSCSSP